MITDVITLDTLHRLSSTFKSARHLLPEEHCFEWRDQGQADATGRQFAVDSTEHFRYRRRCAIRWPKAGSRGNDTGRGCRPKYPQPYQG